jgi:hypothetical protein
VLSAGAIVGIVFLAIIFTVLLFIFLLYDCKKAGKNKVDSQTNEMIVNFDQIHNTNNTD